MFLIFYFVVDVSHFHIYYIANCVVMRDLPIFFLDIINFHLSLFTSGYYLPVYDQCEVEYYVSVKHILAWCGLNSVVIEGPYLP